jgi:hypothetical protein
VPATGSRREDFEEVDLRWAHGRDLEDRERLGATDGARRVAGTGSRREDCAQFSDSDVLAGRGDGALAERTATMVEIHASDLLACGGFLPERVAPRAAGAEKGEIAGSKIGAEPGTGARVGAESLDDAGAEGVTQEDRAVAGRELGIEQPADEQDGTPAAGFGDDLTTAHTGSGGRNVTNEANFYDDVRISQRHEIADVTVDSGHNSGLDNLRTKPKSGQEDVIGNPASEVFHCESASPSGTPLTPARGRWEIGDGGRAGDEAGGGFQPGGAGGRRRWWGDGIFSTAFGLHAVFNVLIGLISRIDSHARGGRQRWWAIVRLKRNLLKSRFCRSRICAVTDSALWQVVEFKFSAVLSDHEPSGGAERFSSQLTKKSNLDGSPLGAWASIAHLELFYVY